MDTIWNILGVHENASVEEIRTAYATAAQECHPEEKPQEFARLQKAYKEALKYARQSGIHGSEEMVTKEEPVAQAVSTPLMDRLMEQETVEQEKSVNTPAMQKFKEIFMDENRRNDRTEWRDFFISETFLDEQYEEAFVRSVHDFLKQQTMIPFTMLPGGLVIELAIVYVLRPERDNWLVQVEENLADSSLYDWKNVTIFEELVADIWNHQEKREENGVELESDASFIRRKSYDEYRTMRKVVLENTWDYKRGNDTMEEYKYTLSMAHWEFLADDDKVNSMDIDDIRVEDDITHACEVELFDYLLRKYGFPVEPCTYMYRYFELENIEQTQYAEVYKNLKAHILEQYPDMDTYFKQNISAEDYADQLRSQLRELQEKYGSLGWGKNFVELDHLCYAKEVVEWCEEEAAEVYKIVKSSLFEKYKFADRLINNMIIANFTVTQAKIFYEIYNKPDICFENPQYMRLVHELFRKLRAWGVQEQYLMSGEYEYDLSLNSYDFWEYFLSVAFSDRSMEMFGNESPIASGFLYGGHMMLPAYMKRVYAPSVEWRLRFTNYNKETGRFEEVQRRCFKLNEKLELTIEFHYHYIRYFMNDKEVLYPAWDAKELIKFAGDEGGEAMFMLLLPITYIAPEDAQEVFDRLMDILPGLVRFPASVIFIATMIANDNASIYEMEDLCSRQYIENLTDCYRLDRDSEGQQLLYHFHPKYGCWEYYGDEMIGEHYRDTFMGEQDEEGWDMETFSESDLSLPYEVETKVYDVSGLKTKEKVTRLLELFIDENEQFPHENEVILVFGDKNCMPLRQHFAIGAMLNEEMEEKAYEEHRYLDMQTKSLVKYAKEELAWKGWMELENFHGTVPIAIGKSGSCYAHGVPYGKGTKKKSFADLFHKLICLDDLTQVIAYKIENRSEWN